MMMQMKEGDVLRQSRIYNPEELKNRDEQDEQRNEENIYDIQLSDSLCPKPEKILKVVFAGILFCIVLGSGYVARITIHILLWHLNPPTEMDQSKLNTLGGLHACSGSFTEQHIMVDPSWIWSVFLVIVAPYFLTVLSTLFRICFKSNKPVKPRILIVVMVVETLHSVGLSIMAFLILPSFDPGTASIVYLAYGVFPPLLNFIDKLFRERRQSKSDFKEKRRTSSKWHPAFPLRNKSSKISLMFPFIGLLLQITGIILIAIYTEIGWVIGLFVMSTILVSVKHWENFIHMGGEKSTGLRHLKYEYQRSRTKIMCLANLWKIIITFLAVIAIYTSRADDSTTGFKALFNNFDNSTSILNAVFGERVIGDDPICKFHTPFVVAIISIVCDYLCYKASKTACAIYCQIFSMALPLYLLPIGTTFTLVGLMFKPDILKFSSCDLYFSDWCLESIDQLGEKATLIVIAFVVLYISMILINRHVWRKNGYRHGETSRIFVSPFYCGVLLDLSLMMNRRRHDREYDMILGKKEDNETVKERKTTKLYACCATMWHETANEMTQLLKSIFRLDKRQKINKLISEQLSNDDDDDDDNINEQEFDLEAHIFFDDAFEPLKEGEKYSDVNEYVKTFIAVIEEAGSIVHGKAIHIPDGEMYRAPYGARIEWKLPGGNDLIVHLKDKNKIRHKKRWSQVMYMYYILKWKLMGKYGTDKKNIAEAAADTFLLALDGDVDFEPEAVISLMARMKKSPFVGAACGRIHPIGSGPMVWYQKFEYAVSHWLQKALEHVIGCVLCSPGCFSLFRGSAILNRNVLETYTKVPQQPLEYLQCDQGEDRWLCTLLIKQGWQVEYCAESDAYTFAPEGFYEFYNQRRRWTPSTMANIIDIILDWKLVTKNNDNISCLYILYQTLFLASCLLTPGTIFMIIVGAIIVGFQSVPPWLALVLNVIPVGIFLLMCIYASSQRQLQFAAILSSIYAIVMIVVLIGVVKDAVEEGICSMTTIFIIFVVFVFVTAAVLHPMEFLCIIPGLLYYIAIPSMSMLMFLYAIGNLHVVSWGTREAKKPDSPEKEKPKFKPEKEETGYFFSIGNFFSCICCPTNTYSKEDFLYKNMLDKVKHILPKDNQEQTADNHVKDADSDEQQIQNTATGKENENMAVGKKEKQEKKRKKQLTLKCDKSVAKVPKEEAKFWKKTIKKYLRPLDKDEAKEKQMQEDLLDLRNRVSLSIFLLNAVLVTAMYALTQVDSFNSTLSVRFTCKGNDVTIVPIAVLFAVVFGLLLLLQFIGMLYHRFSTLIHISAGTELFDSEKTKNEHLNFKIANYLTTPVISKPPKATRLSDKDRRVLDNRSLIMPEEEERIEKLDEVVEKQINNLKNFEGSLKGSKRIKLAKDTLQKWFKSHKSLPGLAQRVMTANRKSKKKLNKVEPQDIRRNRSSSSMSDSSQGTSHGIESIDGS